MGLRWVGPGRQQPENRRNNTLLESRRQANASFEEADNRAGRMDNGTSLTAAYVALLEAVRGAVFAGAGTVVADGKEGEGEKELPGGMDRLASADGHGTALYHPFFDQTRTETETRDLPSAVRSLVKRVFLAVDGGAALTAASPSSSAAGKSVEDLLVSVVQTMYSAATTETAADSAAPAAGRRGLVSSAGFWWPLPLACPPAEGSGSGDRSGLAMSEFFCPPVLTVADPALGFVPDGLASAASQFRVAGAAVESVCAVLDARWRLASSSPASFLGRVSTSVCSGTFSDNSCAHLTAELIRCLCPRLFQSVERREFIIGPQMASFCMDGDYPCFPSLLLERNGSYYWIKGFRALPRRRSSLVQAPPAGDDALQGADTCACSEFGSRSPESVTRPHGSVADLEDLMQSMRRWLLFVHHTKIRLSIWAAGLSSLDTAALPNERAILAASTRDALRAAAHHRPELLPVFSRLISDFETFPTFHHAASTSSILDLIAVSFPRHLLLSLRSGGDGAASDATELPVSPPRMEQLGDEHTFRPVPCDVDAGFLMHMCQRHDLQVPPLDLAATFDDPWKLAAAAAAPSAGTDVLQQATDFAAVAIGLDFTPSLPAADGDADLDAALTAILEQPADKAQHAAADRPPLFSRALAAVGQGKGMTPAGDRQAPLHHQTLRAFADWLRLYKVDMLVQSVGTAESTRSCQWIDVGHVTGAYWAAEMSPEERLQWLLAATPPQGSPGLFFEEVTGYLNVPQLVFPLSWSFMTVRRSTDMHTLPAAKIVTAAAESVRPWPTT